MLYLSTRLGDKFCFSCYYFMVCCLDPDVLCMWQSVEIITVPRGAITKPSLELRLGSHQLRFVCQPLCLYSPPVLNLTAMVYDC